jgi:nicotinamidase/pyrazinamidase
VTKGVRFDQDQNSAFDQTGLARELKKRDIARIWVGGLAEDVCVAATAIDARREGFEVILINDATCPVSLESGSEARQRMKEAGVRMSTDA